MLSDPANGTVSFSNFGYLGSVASYTCDVGFDFVLGFQERTCMGGGWNGTSKPPPTCAEVSCPPLPVLLDGTTTCTGASNAITPGAFDETCSFACDDGFTLLGSTARTCTWTPDLGSMWTGATPPFCSAFNITNSFVTGLVPQYTVVAGDTIGPFQMTIRDSLVQPVETGLDVPQAYVSAPAELASLDNLVTVSTYTTNGIYDVTMRPPTVAGFTYTLQLAVNNVDFVLGTTAVDAEVVPGPVSAAASTLDDLPDTGTLSLETATVVTYSVTLRDAYDNEVTTPPLASAVSIAMRLGVKTTPVTSFSLAGSKLSFSVLVAEGGTYTLRIQVGGEDILGSPYVAQVSTTCLPGTRSVGSGTTGACVPCGVGTYSETRNAAFCTACPEFMRAPEGSASWINCTCLTTYWFGPNGQVEGQGCVPCPFGAVCAGGHEPPRPGPGFELSDDGSSFVACPRPASCAGNGVCTEGYRGRLCAECTKGWYQFGDGCRKCKGSNALIIVCLVLAVFGFVAAVVWINMRNSKVYGYAAFVIALNTLQAVAIYGTIRLEWHPLVRGVFDVVSLVNLNLDLASPECGVDVGDVWMFKWGMTMALPILFLFPFAVVTLGYIGLRNVMRRWRASRDADSVYGNKRSLCSLEWAVVYAAGRGYLQTILLLYLPLMYAALRYVDCTDVGGGIVVMTTNPQRRCYTSSWYTLLPLILTVALIVGTAIPVLLGMFLKRKQAALDEVTFASKYAFLVAKYRSDLFWYELVILGRKLGVVVSVCAFSSPTVKATMVALMLQCVLAYSLLGRHYPYAERHHNMMDFSTLFGSVVLLWGGTITSSRVLRDGVVIAALVALLGIVCVGVVYELWRIKQRDQEDAELVFENIEFEGAGMESGVEMMTVGHHAAVDFDSGVLESENGLMMNPVFGSTNPSFGSTNVDFGMTPYRGLDSVVDDDEAKSSLVDGSTAQFLAMPMSTMAPTSACNSLSSCCFDSVDTSVSPLTSISQPPPMPLSMPPPPEMPLVPPRPPGPPPQDVPSSSSSSCDSS